MRQADDERYASAMRRIRLHELTDNDIALLNSRISAPIPDSDSVPIVVRRHTVRHEINKQRLNDIASAKAVPILHCKASILKSNNLTNDRLYRVIQGPRKALADGIPSVIPSAPLLITKNLNYLPIPLVNGTIVHFFGFATPSETRSA